MPSNQDSPAKIARIVFVVLVANFVAALVPRVLPLSAVFNSPGAVLREIVAGRAGPTYVWPVAGASAGRAGSVAGTNGSGSDAGTARRKLCRTAR